MSVRKMNQRLVSPENFCMAWKAAADKNHTIQDLADTLEMTYNAVLNRANYYSSRHGIVFPLLERRCVGPAPINAKALQKILNSRR